MGNSKEKSQDRAPLHEIMPCLIREVIETSQYSGKAGLWTAYKKILERATIPDGHDEIIKVLQELNDGPDWLGRHTVGPTIERLEVDRDQKEEADAFLRRVEEKVSGYTFYDLESVIQKCSLPTDLAGHHYDRIAKDLEVVGEDEDFANKDWFEKILEKLRQGSFDPTTKKGVGHG